MRPSNQDLLRRAGEATFGTRWQSEVARMLSVTVRTVQRWAAGTTPMSDDVLRQMAETMRTRGQEMMFFGEGIEKYLDGETDTVSAKETDR